MNIIRKCQLLKLSGRQSDKYGNIAQWWTKDTLAQYLTRSKCFIDEVINNGLSFLLINKEK